MGNEWGRFDGRWLRLISEAEEPRVGELQTCGVTHSVQRYSPGLVERERRRGLLA